MCQICIIKVTKPSILVVKDHLKVVNLYMLHDSSFSVNVVIALDSETTKICHMCLGHMNAIDMTELSKIGLLDDCHCRQWRRARYGLIWPSPYLPAKKITL
jgi:hypothetical protein